MRLDPDGFFQLTYCTNIHPSNGWDDVLANLRRYAPPLKARFAPDAPFGIGLRLSGVESRQLLDGDRLEQFRAFLDEQGLYVFTLNGFQQSTVMLPLLQLQPYCSARAGMRGRRRPGILRRSPRDGGGIRARLSPGRGRPRPRGAGCR